MPRGKGRNMTSSSSRGGGNVFKRNVNSEASIRLNQVEEQPLIEQIPAEQAAIEQADLENAHEAVASDHVESDEPTLDNTQRPQDRREPRKAADGRIYLEPYKRSYHPHQAVRELSRIMKKWFTGPWAKWDDTPLEVKDRWFAELKKSYIWEEKYDSEIRRLYDKVVGKARLRGVLYYARKNFKEKKTKPMWMNEECWDQLQQIWSNLKFKEKSETNAKNRLSNKDGLGPSCHTGGSIPYSEHKRKYEEMHGVEPRPSQLFVMTHKNKGTGDFVDKKSKAIWEKFESEMKESLGDTSNVGNDEHHEDLENTNSDREMLVWTKVVGGPTKGKLYGLGSESSGIVGSHNSLSATSQASAETPSLNQMSLEEVEKMREEVRLERERMHDEVQKEKREREGLQKQVQDLQLLVQQLLQNSGLPFPPSLAQSPVNPSVGSTSAQNKDK